jgi:glycosyltransferase involved in cell wall biosynthesis
MDIAFLITTYNREESCQRLVDSLQGLGDVYVVNDGCDYDISGATQYKLKGHGGRFFYWATVNFLFKQRGKHKYYFMLPDDFLIRESQILRAIEIWEGIKDPQKICLNLHADRIKCKCWTNFLPIDKGNVWLSQWVDMCFLCEDRFFDKLGVMPKTLTRTGSGVGAYISRRLFRNRYNLYQVKEDLITFQPEHWNSQMHRQVIKDRYETNSRHRHVKDTRKI